MAMKITIEASDDDLEEMLRALRAYQRLHDGLSDMIEGGRLKKRSIPDDYYWLIESLAEIGAMPANN